MTNSAEDPIPENSGPEGTSENQADEPIAPELKFTGQAYNDLHQRAAPELLAQILQPGSVRDELMDKHPLTIDQQLLITPTMNALFRRAAKAIKFRLKGLAAFGPPGMGKTCGVTGLSLMLAKAYPNIPVFDVIALPHDDFTEKTLWIDIIPKGKKTRNTSAKEIFRDLVALMAAAAQAARSQMVILIIDEAQHWRISEWRYLKGLTNILGKANGDNVRLLTISLGQSSLHTQILNLKNEPDDGEDLRIRFFDNPHAFSGFENAAGLHFVLGQLDSAEFTEFPDGSGVCYTEFFAPEAYAAGWRIATEAERMWLHLCEHVPGTQSISAAVVFKALRQFLWNAAEEDGIGFRGDDRRWGLAIKGWDLDDEAEAKGQERGQ